MKLKLPLHHLHSQSYEDLGHQLHYGQWLYQELTQLTTDRYRIYQAQS